jgi:prepilin-type N-terminal cleavage/methylation domain-containing protein
MTPRKNARHGFTLVELLIVIAIIAILAAFAIPSLLSARLSADEAGAIGTLRAVAAAQASFRADRRVNRNRNEEGEYGYFAEMSQRMPPRAAAIVVPHPYLPGAFRSVSGGVVTRSGYVFRMVLPGPGGLPAPETLLGGEDVAMPVEDMMAESIWVCYGWPAVNGSTGVRVFCITNDGDILWQDNKATLYSGLTMPCPPDAAFTQPNDVLSPRAIRVPGNDGATWYPLR